MVRSGILQRKNGIVRLIEMIRQALLSICIFCFAQVGYAQGANVWNDKTQSVPVLASLGSGEIITKTDLQKYVGSRIDMGGAFKNTFSVESALEAMILTRVLVLEGMELSMPRLKKEALDEKYDDQYGYFVFRKLSASCLPLQNKEEEKAFFQNNPDLFVLPTSARLIRFMLPADQPVEGVNAVELMMNWRNAWLNRELSLEQIAAKAAKIYNIEVQGDIGWIQLFDEIEIMRPVKLAKAGEMLDPVTEGDFVYLFYVVDKRAGRSLQWAEVEGHVSQKAVSSCAKKNADEIKSRLYKKYGVTIYKDNIKKLFSATVQ